MSRSKLSLHRSEYGELGRHMIADAKGFVHMRSANAFAPGVSLARVDAITRHNRKVLADSLNPKRDERLDSIEQRIAELAEMQAKTAETLADLAAVLRKTQEET